MQRFKAAQWVPYPVDVVFAFFANPYNLPLLMPERMRMRIDRVEWAPAPVNFVIAGAQLAQSKNAAGVGSRIEISFRPVHFLPVRASWEALITEFAWFSHFCDEQVKGPFEHFRHRHGIQQESRQGQMGTELTDEVEFSLPFGAAGQLLEGAVLGLMSRMFRTRQERLPVILEEKMRVSL